MKKSKNRNWLLLGALMFFLVSAGFTTSSTLQSSGGCYICDAVDTCKDAYNDQTGQENCSDWYDFDQNEYYCTTWGEYCEPGGGGGEPPEDPE